MSSTTLSAIDIKAVFLRGIQNLIDIASEWLESETDLDKRRQSFDILDTVGSCINSEKITMDKETIDKYYALREKYDASFAKHEVFKPPEPISISDSYTNLQSMFSHNKDHILFAEMLQTIEQSNKMLPFSINKLIAEFATGSIYICADEECTKEILAMNEVSEDYAHCPMTNRYFCEYHVINTQQCDECDALKYVPESIGCDYCGENICENPQCIFGVDVNQSCYSCNALVCIQYNDYHNKVGLCHCTECKVIMCGEADCCSLCVFCDNLLCTKCEEKYTFKCKKKSSKQCADNGNILNHPSCKGHRCECEIKEPEACGFCIQHNCSDKTPPMPPDFNTVCSGFKCNLCKAML